MTKGKTKEETCALQVVSDGKKLPLKVYETSPESGFIDFAGAFTKLTMKKGGCRKFTYWVHDPAKEVDQLSRLCVDQDAAKSILSDVCKSTGKIRLPGHGRLLRLAFQDRNELLFTKDGVSLGEIYLEVKSGKQGLECSASVTFDIPAMKKEFNELCAYCSSGEDVWLKICEPQAEIF